MLKSVQYITTYSIASHSSISLSLHYVTVSTRPYAATRNKRDIQEAPSHRPCSVPLNGTTTAYKTQSLQNGMPYCYFVYYLQMDFLHFVDFTPSTAIFGRDHEASYISYQPTHQPDSLTSTPALSRTNPNLHGGAHDATTPVIYSPTVTHATCLPRDFLPVRSPYHAFRVRLFGPAYASDYTGGSPLGHEPNHQPVSCSARILTHHRYLLIAVYPRRSYTQHVATNPVNSTPDHDPDKE